MLPRLALLSFWCLVFWGTLWDLAVVWKLLTSGWSATAAALLQTSPELAAATWGNRGCGLLAAFVWVVLPLARWSSSRRTA